MFERVVIAGGLPLLPPCFLSRRLHQLLFSPCPLSVFQGYRYPAPGSQPTARVPTEEEEDQKYDIKYFTVSVRDFVVARTHF